MPEQTIDRVIEGGYCIGCGVCSAMRPEEFALSFSPEGMFRSERLVPAEARRDDISGLCPMSGAGPDESEIAAALWPGLPAHPGIGRHALTAVAWVEEGGFRAAGSSGGLLSWLAAEMLRRGLVEEVVQVAPRQASGPQDDGMGNGGPALFSYHVSRSPEDVRRAAKSRYYPVHARDAIAHIRASGRPTLFMGLPCFVKMIRTLARTDPAVEAAVKFTLGLVCGHLKSAGFAQILAWQAGVPPERIETVDFRVKVPDRPASSYGFMARDAASHRDHQALMADLVGHDWGQGMMKYKACDYCDDVLAECADIAIGDAWLEPWRREWQGANICVARHPVIVAILEEAAAAGRLHVEPVSPDRAAESQGAGLRHRREGLAWRLWRDQRKGLWVPRKRVAPSAALPRQRQMIYDARDRIRDDSHQALLEARRSGRFETFVDRMRPALAQYARANRGTLAMRLKRKLRNGLDRLRGARA